MINPFKQKYAGDITPKQAWEMLGKDKDALLLDVRTHAELTFVGVPDSSSIGKETIFAQWSLFPDMRTNTQFASEVADQGAKEDNTLLIICRSGKRSEAAAKALTSLGFKKCYNIAAGFEGDLDQSNHRGSINGWKADGLPWRQG